jgi:hypothetical protein
MKRTIIATALAVGLTAGLAMGATAAFAATDADVDNTFSPYKKGFPSFPGVTPGLVINKANVDQFKDILAVGTYKIIKDGFFEMKIGASSDFALAKQYVDATRANLNKTKLGPKNGDLEGYVAGRPFPE